MKLTLRKFTEEGVKAASELINELRDRNVKWSNDLKLRIDKLLLDQELVIEYSDVEINQDLEFENRFEFGKYLYEKIGDIDTEAELGLLTWLTFFFFDQIVEIKKNKSIVYRSQENYIPQTHQFRAYRHRIIAPYLAYRNMKEDAIIILTNPTYEGGDSVNNWLSRTYFISNKKAVKLGRLIYFDEDEKSLKTAAFSNKEGNAINFAKNFIPQLMVNYDLYTCPIEKLINLLPEEFENFMNK